MTDNEKTQLIKGLFLTTGVVLGVASNQIDQSGGIFFAIISAAVFYLAFFAANKTGKSKPLFYVGAAIIWFLMYKLFHFL